MIVVAVLTLFAAVFIFAPISSGTAFADGEVDVVFPTSGYMQSEAPTLISANENYLLIYDSAQNRLYVRSNTNLGNYDYVLNLASADKLFAVGNKAFFVADDAYYSLDLTSKTSALQQVALATPDEISYFTSDGTYLYAVSSWGYITIYDDSFAPALNHNNTRNANLLGELALVGEADTLYIFGTSYGFARYTILNLTSGDAEQLASPLSGVQAASLGSDVIYALSSGEIICVDKSTGTMLLSSGIEPTAFSAYGDKLFTIEGNSVRVYTLSNDLTSIELVDSLSMTGNDATHFNSPVDIEKLPSKFAVADANNNRIAYFDGTGNELSSFQLDSTPKRLTRDGSVLYILTDNQILELDSLYVKTRYDAEGVIDILYLDKLYALKADGVYVLIGGEFSKFYDVQNAVSLACAEEGKNLFVGTATEIVVLDKQGTKLPTALTGDFAGLKDIAVDYAGNIVVAYADKVDLYTNNISSLALASSTPLAGEYRATLTGCVLAGDRVCFTTQESYVGSLQLNVFTKATYAAPQIADDVYSLAYSYMRPSSENAYVLPSTLRAESISLAPQDVVIVLQYEAAPQGLKLAFDGTSLTFIHENDFEVVETEALTGEYVAKEETVLYKMPNVESANNVTLASDEHVVFKRTTAGFDGGIWVVVEYENAEYFAKRADFEEYVAPAPERKAEYGRAKGTRVGGIVNVYASADAESEIILEIADGAKVEILETLDGFYKVKVDETVGYMRSEDVQLKGLTTVQIISIVLAVLVLLAGSTVFAAIYLTKKKEATKE